MVRCGVPEAVAGPGQKLTAALVASLNTPRFSGVVSNALALTAKILSVPPTVGFSFAVVPQSEDDTSESWI